MSHEKPFRILRLIARLNIGGPAIQTVALSSELPKDTYQTLLVCGRISPGEGDMSYLVTERGIKPMVIPYLGREISFFRDIKTFIFLRRVIVGFKPHIIHTHTAKAGFLGRLAALSVNIALPYKSRIRTVHTFHGHTFHSYFSSAKTFVFIWIERCLARITNRIIVISERQKADICHQFRVANRERVDIIPLGFDLTSFKDCNRFRSDGRRRYFSSESNNTFLVGAIGRLTPVKNFSMLLKTVRHLKDQGKIDNFRFLIVGDGELRRDLENEIKFLDIGDVITLTGWEREMAPVYAALDAVVLTSKNEGTPVSLIEAMAAQRPVIATDVGGVPDLIGKTEVTLDHGVYISKRGVRIRSDDPEALAKALLYLQENSRAIHPMINRARDFVDRIYLMERLVTDIQRVYTELMQD